jgi:threonyl-tRNA synthetase
MQLLLLHSDYLEYEAKEKTKDAEEIDDSKRRKRMEDVLVAFTAIEKVDEENPEFVISRAVEDIKEVVSRVGAQHVLIYPYAHLSQDLSSPSFARLMLSRLQKSLKESGVETSRAPFGWYKSFSLKCKGHPLSELSRSIKPEKVPKALQMEQEQKISSSFYIMDSSGKMIPLDKFDFHKYENLKRFADYEVEKSRVVEKIPPHVELMKRLGIADHEPGSDPGNLRYYPKGRMIKSLLENFVSSSSHEFGALEVETPVMYDMDHPTLRNYLDRFPARQYVIESDKRNLFLRFSACFGQFLMGKDMVVSYRNLPLRIFELTRYSFRREQSGELVGLRRLRSFTMPDMHTLCGDMKDALDEFMKQYELCESVLKKIGIDGYEIGIRFTRDFYEKNSDFIRKLVKRIGRPVLVEIWEKLFFYFALKLEFNFIDFLEKASCLSTVQIDVENASRYGIKYVDEKGMERYPVILHCSPSGAIERCIYALLESAWISMEEGKLPLLPLWLSPTQVRLIPVSKDFLPYTEKIAEELGNIRVDVDDRDESLSRKIRDASMEWIPFIGVIGEEEVKGDYLTVTIRKESTKEKMKKIKVKTGELREMIERETDGLPYGTLPLNRRLSERAKF